MYYKSSLCVNSLLKLTTSNITLFPTFNFLPMANNWPVVPPWLFTGLTLDHQPGLVAGVLGVDEFGQETSLQALVLEETQVSRERWTLSTSPLDR